MTQLGLLPALAAPAMRRTAHLSDDGRYRWVLRRRWAPGKRSACWIMLNPSTADAEVDDPTVREVIRFSRLWFCDAATVVNLYPFRSPHPSDCRRWANWEAHGPDWHARDVIERNGWIVAEESRRADIVIAAWGAAPWAQDWAQHLIEDRVVCGAVPCPNLHCLGTNTDGSPKHPLARGRHRVPREQRPILYRRGAGNETRAEVSAWIHQGAEPWSDW